MAAVSFPNRLKFSPQALAWLAVIAAVLILVARKPWALHTPQLWAEDGSIHLNEVDQWGAHALFKPYRGYVNLAPRLIAWIASRTADVAYWPAIYNGCALLVTALLFARTASPRFAVAQKTWLALSFVLVAHSGEVFLNITNLHWLCDLFLVQQVLMLRPTRWTQRAGDYALILLAGLSDPCALIFLPVFIWRWWSERDRDNLAVMVLVAGCAAVQAFHLHATGLTYGHDGSTQPFDLLRFLCVSGIRLVIWPFLGARTTGLLPPLLQALIAWALIALIAAWSFRPAPERMTRLRILGAWALITVACVVRIRPDAWTLPIDNLGYAEPYFFASRLLLFWLVISQFDAEPKMVRWIARTACVASVCLQLPHYRVPAPPDYHWAEKCGPIRTGTRADIPILPEGWTLQYWGHPPKR